MCFRFDCKDPYKMLDDTDAEIRANETEMLRIQESASLFEVNVPDFKQLKQCRRELRMLKVNICIINLFNIFKPPV